PPPRAPTASSLPYPSGCQRHPSAACGRPERELRGEGRERRVVAAVQRVGASDGRVEVRRIGPEDRVAATGGREVDAGPDDPDLEGSTDDPEADVRAGVHDSRVVDGLGLVGAVDDGGN